MVSVQSAQVSRVLKHKTLSALKPKPVRHCAQAQEEVDRVLGDRENLTVADFRDLRYCMRCVNESMRLYPHPPVLLRRAMVPDVLPGGYEVQVGQVSERYRGLTLHPKAFGAGRTPGRLQE